jgi:hypothetical protein
MRLGILENVENAQIGWGAPPGTRPPDPLIGSHDASLASTNPRNEPTTLAVTTASTYSHAAFRAPAIRGLERLPGVWASNRALTVRPGIPSQLVKSQRKLL